MGYAGDMSSTIPADKKFTTRQREIYDLQVAMHLESVKALRPGVPFVDVYDLSARVMVEGLKQLGLMKEMPMMLFVKERMLCSILTDWDT